MAPRLDPALKLQVRQLAEEGMPERVMARTVGVSRSTVRMWLGRLPEKAGKEDLQVLRVRVFRGLVALVEEKIAAKNLTGMRDLLVAYGIADDKVSGRKQGIEVSQTVQPVTMIRIAPDVG